LTVVYIVENK